MIEEVKSLIESKDYDGIKQLLSNNPNFANEGITIPYDSKCTIKAHPLHRICDAVFVKKITDEEAIKIAKIFLASGANIDGDKLIGNNDTPLLAAASLHAEQLAIFYIENGADIYHKDKHDGATALHWAAYCGRDKLVEKLIQQRAVIDQRDASYNSTPLGWAVHALISADKTNTYNQVSCIKLLLKAGANITELNNQAIALLHELAKDDLQLEQLLN
jgi:ankyrin repeat protein